MSLFARRSAAGCAFRGPDAWVVLSPLEQAIRRKIEAAGSPLKDWDVQINYGIKTGYNDAFIVTTERREEILAACRTEAERERTAALIRPILRGRDIRRYGYQWAGLWIINTHNGIKGQLERVHIEDYPAVKAHLDQYWDKISTRTDKGDTPYNLRNCAYMGDFARPKIVWKIIGSRLAFAIDDKGYMLNNACYIMTGEHLRWILAFLNSSPLIWYSEITNMNKTGVGDALVGLQNIILFPIPSWNGKDSQLVENLVEQLTGTPSDIKLRQKLAEVVYSFFHLNKEEIAFLESLRL